MSSHKDRSGSNPVKSFKWCADDLDMHLATFKRNVLPVIATVQTSKRRRGVLLSVHEDYKKSRTRPPARQIEKDAAK